MKIVVFFTFDTSLTTWRDAGILHRELRLYKELSSSGVRVVLITYGDDTDRSILADYPYVSVIPAYGKIRRPGSKYLRFLDSFCIPFRFSSELASATIFKSNQLWGGWVPAFAGLVFRKKVILRVGYEPYLNSINQTVGVFPRFVLYILSFLTYRFADRVIVTTESIASFIERKFVVSKEKIVLIPNWVDTEAFSPTTKLSTEFRFDVLFVGRLSAEKDLNLLIEALAGTALTLGVVGAGRLRGELTESAKKSGVRATFLGVVEHQTLPAIYRSCKTFVLCSDYEGNPKTLLEAMACGCGVVGTNVPGIRECIESGESGILVEKDAVLLRRAIERLTNDVDYRVRMGMKARVSILRSNSFATHLLKEKDVYKSLNLAL